MAKSQDLQKLFDASQEVVQEAFATALRVADERGVDPQALIRASFSQLQSMGFGMGFGGSSNAAAKAAPKRASRPRSASTRKS